MALPLSAARFAYKWAMQELDVGPAPTSIPCTSRLQFVSALRSGRALAQLAGGGAVGRVCVWVVSSSPRPLGCQLIDWRHPICLCAQASPDACRSFPLGLRVAWMIEVLAVLEHASRRRRRASGGGPSYSARPLPWVYRMTPAKCANAGLSGWSMSDSSCRRCRDTPLGSAVGQGFPTWC